MKTIELKASKVSLRDDGIMHVHIKEGIEMQVGDAMKVVKAVGKLGNKKKFPILIDCDEFASIDPEAWLYAESKEANIYTSADAIAYHSLAHKLLADFYIRHKKLKIPTQVFKANEDAIRWLKTFTNKTGKATA